VPSTATGRILVVDDEAQIRSLLRRVLTAEGYEVELTETGAAALRSVGDHPPDLVVLDVNLPDDDGRDLLTTIRESSDVPVILLTGMGEEADRVLGLKLGADDYVVKPFSPTELAARIQTVLRRAAPKPKAGNNTKRLTFEGLCIDLATRDVEVDGKPVELTAKEFDLLAFLAASPRQVFSRDQLLDHVWGSSSDWQDDATVTEHVRRLRRRIEADPQHPKRILTVRGAGYRFQP
jgi:DNA-binding response OmpR family regulator